ncbi:MAG: NUDIX domain-containing protein [Cyanobacteria bacterium P01_H01_bin.15]
MKDTSLAGFNVGVDNVIFSVDTTANRLQVLLCRSPTEPLANSWRLPGTLVQVGESLEDAAHRSLSEKFTAKNLYLEQLYTFGGGKRTTTESEGIADMRYLSVSYFALVHFEDVVLAPQDQQIAWHTLHAIPSLVAEHKPILDYGYRRLRNKLEYSPIAFDVLPEVFTLNEIYQLYGTILGPQFSDYSNFRARLLKLGILFDTGEKVTRGAGRPASLYRFDADAFAPLKDKPLVFV